MATILVTGGAGFIGSQTIRHVLTHTTDRIVSVDNFDRVYDRSFKEGNIAPYAGNDRFVSYEVDICDSAALANVFEKEKPTHVIHLAAKADTRDAVTSPLPYVYTNINGSLNVFQLAHAHNVSHIVSASSSSVYGNHPNLPWSEIMSDIHPISPYGVTKLAMEHLAYSFHYNFGTSITCLRYFNVYGEGNRPGMVPYKWAEALLTGASIEMSGDGERRRDYTYVGDVVEATLRALETPLGFQVINIGHGSPLSLNELLALFETVTNKKAVVTSRPSHHASVDATYANNEKARTLLGWSPRTSHEVGIEQLVQWFSEHRLPLL